MGMHAWHGVEARCITTVLLERESEREIAYWKERERERAREEEEETLAIGDACIAWG